MDTDTSCKKFETEAEIEERRRRRQEEWEKVRKPEDPAEAPEEEYDPRSLYERLQEQKDKKQAEYEESHRLKNLIKGLDDDEVAFLELVDKTKMDMETKLWNEEMNELKEFNKAVANLSEEKSEARLNELRKTTMRLPVQASSKKSQQDLLSASVKRKASNGNTSPEKKARHSESDDSHEEKDVKANADAPLVVQGINPATLQCLGILPGLGAYTDSSDSENSSNSENERESDYDLIGRKKLCLEHAATANVNAKNQNKWSQNK